MLLSCFGETFGEFTVILADFAVAGEGSIRWPHHRRYGLKLFQAHTDVWLSTSTSAPRFKFNSESTVNKASNDSFTYVSPNFTDADDYLLMCHPPEVLGLHPNADLTFRFKEITQLLDTILETQPK